MRSIRHFPATHPLPDWRNIGVVLRTLLGINALAALAALLMSNSLSAWPGMFMDVASFVEPVLLQAIGQCQMIFVAKVEGISRRTMTIFPTGIASPMARTSGSLRIGQQNAKTSGTSKPDRR